MAGVRHINVMWVKAQVTASIQLILLTKIEDAIEELKGQLEKLLAPTLDIGNNPYTAGNEYVNDVLGRPRLEFDAPKIEVVKGKVTAQIGCRVVREDGSTYHNLWYWLSAGTDGVQYFPVTTPYFPARIPNRTDPGSLDTGNYGGDDYLMFIKKNAPRDGIEPRNWSETASRMLKNYFENNEIAGLSGWELTYKVDDNVDLAEI